MVKLLPFQGHTASAVSDSVLMLRPKNTTAGYHVPELTTMDELNAIGVNKVTQHIGAGTEIKSITLSAGDCTQTELDMRRTLGASGSDDVGCFAMTDPDSKQPYGFEKHIVEGAAMINFRSGKDTFGKKGTVRETPSLTQKAELLNPCFDEIAERCRATSTSDQCHEWVPRKSTLRPARAITCSSTTPKPPLP